MISKDNRIVQGLWIGGRLSELERLCIRSFCAHGHEFHLYHYDELQNLPKAAGLRVMDAAEVLPRQFAFDKKGNVSWFADHFQYELLRQKGGWWADMDMVCLRPLDFAEDIVAARFGLDYPLTLSVAIMKFPRGHPAVVAAADCYRDIDRFQPWDTPRVKRRKIRRRLMFWRDSRKKIDSDDGGGMFGFAAIVRHYGLGEYAQPTHVFHLIDSGLLHYAFDGTLHDMGALEPMLSRSYAVHLSNAWLNKWKLNKDGAFPENSLYEILKRRYPEPGE